MKSLFIKFGVLLTLLFASCDANSSCHDEAAAVQYHDSSSYLSWSTLTPSSVREAFPGKIAECERRIDAIARLTPEQMSWENTFQAYTEITDYINRQCGVLLLFGYSHVSDEWRELYDELMPKWMEYWVGIHQHAGLWKVLKVAEASDWLKQEDPMRQLEAEKICDYFKQNGVDIAPQHQERARSIAKEIKILSGKLTENLQLSEKQCFLHVPLSKRNLLQGISKDVLERARQAALESGQDGYVFTWSQGTLYDVIRNCQSAELRKSAWEAQYSMGKTPGCDNRDLWIQMGALRQELAELYGFDTYADMFAHRSMMGTGAAALDFVDDVMQGIKPPSDALYQLLLSLRNRYENTGVRKLPLWDYNYYNNLCLCFMHGDEGMDDAIYFSFENALQGAFKVYEELCGIEFRERPTAVGAAAGDVAVDVWLPEIRCWELYDVESGKYLGIVYGDFYSRPGKKYGAWVQPLRLLWPSQKSDTRPPYESVMCLNFSKEYDGLSINGLRIIFHELGHVVYHALARGCEYVDTDFHELPSILSEKLLTDPEILKTMLDYRMEDEEYIDWHLEKFVRFNQDRLYNLLFTLYVSKIDLELHLNYDKQFKGRDFRETTQRILSSWYSPLEGSFMPSLLHNLMHCTEENYAAGYYSYIWSQVMAEDVYRKFKKEGITNPEVWAEYRRCILEAGCTEPAIQSYRKFMGRDPQPDALLESLSEDNPVKTPHSY